MTLNDKEKAVMATIIMRLGEQESLNYLKEKGHEMSLSTYYRTKGAIQASTLDRLNQIAKEFPTLHAQQIDEIELIRSEMWKQYKREESPRGKVMILKEIKDIQPFISAYNEATKDIVEQWVDKLARESPTNLSPEISTTGRASQKAKGNQ